MGARAGMPRINLMALICATCNLDFALLDHCNKKINHNQSGTVLKQTQAVVLFSC